MPDHELLIAVQVEQVLAELGISTATAQEVIESPTLRHQDFALFGMGSLDWLALATKVEAATGMELPDHALLEPEHRCVSGWAAALSSAEEP